MEQQTGPNGELIDWLTAEYDARQLTAPKNALYFSLDEMNCDVRMRFLAEGRLEIRFCPCGRVDRWNIVRAAILLSHHNAVLRNAYFTMNMYNYTVWLVLQYRTEEDEMPLSQQQRYFRHGLEQYKCCAPFLNSLLQESDPLPAVLTDPPVRFSQDVKRFAGWSKTVIGLRRMMRSCGDSAPVWFMNQAICCPAEFQQRGIDARMNVSFSPFWEAVCFRCPVMELPASQQARAATLAVAVGQYVDPETEMAMEGGLAVYRDPETSRVIVEYRLYDYLVPEQRSGGYYETLLRTAMREYLECHSAFHRLKTQPESLRALLATYDCSFE